MYSVNRSGAIQIMVSVLIVRVLIFNQYSTENTTAAASDESCNQLTENRGVAPKVNLLDIQPDTQEKFAAGTTWVFESGECRRVCMCVPSNCVDRCGAVRIWW